jgi:hypothetical protein
MLVTSFILQKDGSSTHSIEKYFNQFKRLRSCIDSNIILFLDRSFSPDLFESNKTMVIPTSIEETESYAIINSINTPIINFADNEKKNTKDYHAIINSKTEFMDKALEITEDNKLAWFDFGIGHVISKDESFKKLDSINEVKEGIVIPGCWDFKTNILHSPAWRFCGGFFAGDRGSIKKMHSLSTQVLKETLPQITWEVNIWSIMESKYNFPFSWYKADHNDLILNYPYNNV